LKDRCRDTRLISFVTSTENNNVEYYNIEKNEEFLIELLFNKAFTFEDTSKELIDYLNI